MISDATLQRMLAPATARFWGDLIRALLWGAAILTWIIFGQIYARMWRLTFADPGDTDFAIFYYTARMVADGLPMYGTSPAIYGLKWTATHLGNLNPPHLQLLLQPLAAFSYRGAFIIWTLANLACLGGTAAVVVRALRPHLTAARVVGIGALLIASAPFTMVAITSELTFVLMLPLAFAWSAGRAERWRLCGMWLGACISLKLFLLLFLPWLVLTRRWRCFGWAVVSCVSITTIGVLSAGVGNYEGWIATLGQVGWGWMPMNASWPGFVVRTLQGAPSVQPVVAAAWLVQPVSLLGTAAICSITLWTTSALTGTADWDVGFLIVLLGAILASPLGWVYYLPLAVVPLLAVLQRGGWRRVPGRWCVLAIIGGACYYLSHEMTISNQPSSVATLTLGSAYFWATAVTWIAAVRFGRRLAV
jgi:hypothetical protein